MDERNVLETADDVQDLEENETAHLYGSPFVPASDPESHGWKDYEDV